MGRQAIVSHSKSEKHVRNSACKSDQPSMSHFVRLAQTDNNAASVNLPLTVTVTENALQLAKGSTPEGDTESEQTLAASSQVRKKK